MKPHTTLVGPGKSTLVGNGMYYEKGYVRSPANRSAIYPDFDPDYNCLFDIFQIRNVPKDFLKLSPRNERHYIIRGIIARAKEKYYYNDMIRKHLEPIIEEEKKSLSQMCRQINLSLGNHLIIVEKGYTREDFITEHFIVTADTLVYIIHDEHQNRTIRLDAGAYRFDLLLRHMTDGRRRR